MPVTISAKDNVVHEHHEVKGLALDFGWHALQRVRAHLIGERLGNHEAFHGTAARCEALRAELGGEIRVADMQFRRSLSQRHTLRHQPLGSSKDAMLPAPGIAHADFLTAATGLDDARHHGWAWMFVVRWKGGGMCDVIPYSHCTIFLTL